MVPENSTPFKTIVEDYEGKLTDSDRALVSVILGDPTDAVFLSAGELAARVNVHASTVVRLAHKLGFEGYPHLCRKLRHEAGVGTARSERSQRRLDRIEKGSNLTNLIESEIAALTAISNTLSQTQIDLAVERLEVAGTIYIVGRGSAAPLAMHLDRRLRRSGFSTELALNLQKRELAERILGLRAGDAVIVFAFQIPTSLPSGYTALIEHSKSVRASSIVISDAAGPTLRPRSDITLSVSRPDDGEMQLRTGPMLVCEALAMTLSNKNPERAVSEFETLEALRANFRKSKD